MKRKFSLAQNVSNTSNLAIRLEAFTFWAAPLHPLLRELSEIQNIVSSPRDARTSFMRLRLNSRNFREILGLIKLLTSRLGLFYLGELDTPRFHEILLSDSFGRISSENVYKHWLHMWSWTRLSKVECKTILLLLVLLLILLTVVSQCMDRGSVSVRVHEGYKVNGGFQYVVLVLS